MKKHYLCRLAMGLEPEVVADITDESKQDKSIVKALKTSDEDDIFFGLTMMVRGGKITRPKLWPFSGGYMNGLRDIAGPRYVAAKKDRKEIWGPDKSHAPDCAYRLGGECTCPKSEYREEEEDKGCPNCDGTGRDTCPLCSGTNKPFPEEASAIKIPIVCGNEDCPNKGKVINEVTGPRADEDTFYEAFGQGGEEEADYCPCCHELGVAQDPEDIPLSEESEPSGTVEALCENCGSPRGYDGEMCICKQQDSEQKPITEAKTYYLGNLERFMQIAKDIRKEFHFVKATGRWVWTDRDERPEPDSRSFDSFWKALCDAVEPYIGENSREKKE